jgi:hypothetical protein
MKFIDGNHPPFRSYITKTGVDEKEAMRESSSTPPLFCPKNVKP